MERTTLTIPQELRKEINQYDGKNDKERLLNWAEQKEPKPEEPLTKTQIQKAINEKVKKTVKEQHLKD